MNYRVYEVASTAPWTFLEMAKLPGQKMHDEIGCHFSGGRYVVGLCLGEEDGVKSIFSAGAPFQIEDAQAIAAEVKANYKAYYVAFTKCMRARWRERHGRKG